MLLQQQLFSTKVCVTTATSQHCGACLLLGQVRLGTERADKTEWKNYFKKQIQILFPFERSLNDPNKAGVSGMVWYTTRELAKSDQESHSHWSKFTSFI